MHKLLALLLSSATLLGCVTDDRGEEFDPPTAEGKDDSQRSPTDHGVLAFNVAQTATISADAGFHAWQFDVTGDAQIDAWTTYALLGQRRVDTVLYLYQQRAGVNGGPATWGPYIARNDNDGSRTYSRIKRTLGAGRYRLLVKGYAASTRGRFAIELGCNGSCTAPTEICELPAAFTDFRNNPLYAQNGERYINAATELEGTEAAQALAALRFVYDDNTSQIADLAAGLALVDQGSLRVVYLMHLGTNTDLTAIEFGAGDTSVGLLFYGNSLVRAGEISDSQLENCNFFRANTSATRARGEACRATSECQTGLRCQGVFANAGVCISTAPIAGDGNECSSDAACGNAALVCAGATRGGGLCAPAWMRGSFADASSTALADNATTARTVNVRGLATVDTDVTIKLAIDHPKPAQLRITLANPGGTEAVVFQGNATTTGTSLVLNQPVIGFSGDESVNGQWTLRVTDMATGSVGTLRGWTLGVTSRWD